MKRVQLVAKVISSIDALLSMLPRSKLQELISSLGVARSCKNAPKCRPLPRPPTNIHLVCTQQAPKLTWSAPCKEGQSFHAILESYCRTFHLDAQRAALTNQLGQPVQLEEVSQTLTVGD